MRLAFLLTIPATIGLMMLAEPIMSVLYQHRKFTAYDAAEAAGALRFYAIGLAGYAALKVLVNAFYALEMRKIPMFVSLAAVGLNLFLNWLFTVQFGWGHRGLALSTGCIATTNFLVLYLIMRRRLTLLETRAMAAMLGKIAMASVSLIAVCWTGAHFVLADWATQPFWPKLGWLAVTIVAGASAFVACALLLRVTELEQLASGVKRRLNRRAT
jgi:putative peptidoglycan lipid II flippase